MRDNKLTKCSSIVHNPQCFKLKLSVVGRRVIGAELCPAGTFFTTCLLPEILGTRMPILLVFLLGDLFFFSFKKYFSYILFVETVANSI